MKNKVREEKTISEKGWRGIDHPLLEHPYCLTSGSR
jgi:hypothetical protein